MKNILKSIHTVYTKVGYVQKTGEMPGKYTYASETDLLHALRPAMIEAGLIMIPTEQDIVHKEVIEYGKDKNKTIRTILKTTFTIFHCESGEHLTVQCVSEGLDTSDKGLFKAMTGGQKYALRQTFMIPTGDDPDQEEEEKVPEVPEWKWKTEEGYKLLSKYVKEDNQIAFNEVWLDYQDYFNVTLNENPSVYKELYKLYEKMNPKEDK